MKERLDITKLFAAEYVYSSKSKIFPGFNNQCGSIKRKLDIPHYLYSIITQFSKQEMFFSRANFMFALDYRILLVASHSYTAWKTHCA
jgi:hypothetical protein